MPIIEVENLKKRYRDIVAVEDVSFTIEEGEIFGVLGPNGAGKTTSVECVAGLRVRDGGRVSVAGFDPGPDRDELRKILGVQLQSAALPNKLKVREAMELYASFYTNPADWVDLLDRVGLVDKQNAAYGKLSGGQRQRLSIALALVGRPRVAVLDELTTGLDPQARRDTWALIEDIRASGVTIVLVTHFMEEAERLCDRLALIDRGRTVAIDTPAGLIAGVQGEQRISFRPNVPLPTDDLLTALPEVTSVTRAGDTITVCGTGNLPYAVTTTLASQGVIATALRVEQATLDDAFLALTGRTLDGAHS
ncbi:ABC-2 type transport system ATP-binding protein [Sinosporangium album]|uniref:ABC-2 type transport system ATP-binding protein n=1 Tax=Sinosporangium album TaxID=504805 RepID=A0A1G8EQQ3_9ACTN|nr:ABC transporter ATP-binding protein [Sinosporangium album]SDH72205.1 ABC-2 type transport system ATP-binding protein [Sinosporangium album]